jgi:hypothetical protein
VNQKFDLRLFGVRRLSTRLGYISYCPRLRVTNSKKKRKEKKKEISQLDECVAWQLRAIKRHPGQDPQDKRGGPRPNFDEA